VFDCHAGPGSYQPYARRPCVITRPAQAVGTEHCPEAVKTPTRCCRQIPILLELLVASSKHLRRCTGVGAGGIRAGRAGIIPPSKTIWDLIMPGLSARQRKRQSTILHTA
jgi:hypothetical protein